MDLTDVVLDDHDRNVAAAPLLILDFETTSLEPDREVWNIGMERRVPSEPTVWCDLIISDVDLATANEESLRIGHFDERHPAHGGDPGDATLVSEVEAAGMLSAWTTPVGEQRVHIVGAVPSFDEFSGKRLLARHGLEWRAHYHLIDVENLIVGYLRGMLAALALADIPVAARPGYFGQTISSLGEVEALVTPPWSSEALSRAIGVEPPGPAERHTALGDVRWCARIYDMLAEVYDPVGQGAR